MTCIHCNNENLSDYPACADCSPRLHFPNRKDCQCEGCKLRLFLGACGTDAAEIAALALLPDPTVHKALLHFAEAKAAGRPDLAERYVQAARRAGRTMKEAA